jgi:osmotically-inducible protein OsmY
MLLTRSPASLLRPFRGEAVESKALDRLARTDRAIERHVSCEFSQSVLILRGRVSSFYLKQIAQEAVADVEGVKEVVNRVDVA